VDLEVFYLGYVKKSLYNTIQYNTILWRKFHFRRANCRRFVSILLRITSRTLDIGNSSCWTKRDQ